MSKGDPFSSRYEKEQERKRLAKTVKSDDDSPLPDTPIEQAQSARKAGRNDPCPCGSGKKFKQCCGRAK